MIDKADYLANKIAKWMRETKNKVWLKADVPDKFKEDEDLFEIAIDRLETADALNVIRVRGKLRQFNKKSGLRMFNTQKDYDINCVEDDNALTIADLSENHNITNHKIFVIHGHHDGLRKAVAQLIEDMDCKPIVLQEDNRYGHTLIEELENYTNEVDYAIALLTGDDIVTSKKEKDKTDLRPRQNVVFELGLFIMALGRDKVVMLHEPNIEIPSDFLGVKYIEIDPEGEWSIKLSKALKKMGAHVNIEKSYKYPINLDKREIDIAKPPLYIDYNPEKHKLIENNKTCTMFRISVRNESSKTVSNVILKISAMSGETEEVTKEVQQFIALKLCVSEIPFSEPRIPSKIPKDTTTIHPEDSVVFDFVRLCNFNGNHRLWHSCFTEGHWDRERNRCFLKQYPSGVLKPGMYKITIVAIGENSKATEKIFEFGGDRNDIIFRLVSDSSK